MTQLLYITSSSYSGSTLLSFLLNTHPSMLTIGELEGWAYAANETFSCSCGAALAACPFFTHIGQTLADAGLPFAFNDFGTRYRVVANSRLNRSLMAEFPGLHSARAEQVRDYLVARVPRFAGRLAQHDRTNLLFIQTALAARQRTVFVDATKDPYRLRQLRRIPELDIRVIHLLRDPRGVVLSNMKKKNQSAAVAIRLWLRSQETIVRIASEFAEVLTVFYEDLCTAVDPTLAAIHAFVGLPAQPSPRDYRTIPHHILGNEMRLGPAGPIANDLRWRRELSVEDLRVVADACAAFRARHPAHRVAGFIERYGADAVPAATSNASAAGYDGAGVRIEKQRPDVSA